MAVVLSAMVTPAAPVWAEADTGSQSSAPTRSRWSVGLTVGSYAPDLRKLNAALHNQGEVLLQDPNYLIPRNQNLPVLTRDISVEGLSGDANYGMEGQWHWFPRMSVLLVATNWQGRVTKSDTITMSLRSNLPPVIVPRTARYNLNLSQMWLGWRYAFFDRPEKVRLFANFGVFGFSTADLTMDALLKVSEAKTLGLNFASISSTEVHGSAYSSRYGLGGEYFLSKHVSVGFHANYVTGEFQRFRVSRYFPSGFSELPPLPPNATNSLPDNVLPTNPALPVVGDPLQTAQVDEPRETVEVVHHPTNVLLSLDGWDLGAMFRVYY
ncbi:MAG: hypothetical protein OEW11_03390 [Nitrospirota bacterium]|nr:hypothetical protein [Nitrospirota bacterium]